MDAERCTTKLIADRHGYCETARRSHETTTTIIATQRQPQRRQQQPQQQTHNPNESKTYRREPAHLVLGHGRRARLSLSALGADFGQGVYWLIVVLHGAVSQKRRRCWDSHLSSRTHGEGIMWHSTLRWIVLRSILFLEQARGTTRTFGRILPTLGNNLQSGIPAARSASRWLATYENYD